MDRHLDATGVPIVLNQQFVELGENRLAARKIEDACRHVLEDIRSTFLLPFSRKPGRVKSKYAHRAGDVLDLKLSKVLEGERQLISDLIANGAGDADATRLRQSF